MTERSKQIIHIGFAFSLHAAFFFGFLRISIPPIPYLYPISLILTALFGFLRAWEDFHLHPIKIAKRIGENVRDTKWLFIALLVYILLDTIGLFYSPYFTIAFGKTIQVFLKLFLGLFMLYYIEGRRQVALLLDNITLVGLVSAAITYLMYFTGHPVYWQRLTAVRDYNQFSLLLLISFLCLLIRLYDNGRLSSWMRYLLIALSCMVYFPIFLLSGSRRTLLLWPAVLMFILIFFTVQAIVKKSRKEGKKILALMICLLLAAGTTFLFEGFFTSYAEWQTERQHATSPSGEAGDSNSLDETIQTVIDGKAVQKRSIIWGIAWDEIKTMQPIELLFGKGAGYELYLYDKQDYQALNEAYPDLEKSAGWMHPHSFILSDLLSGGLLKCAVSLFLFLASIIVVFRIMRLYPNKALYFLPLGLSFVNCAMSGKFGLLYDKTFWFFIVLLMAFLAVLKRDRAAGKTEIS